MSRIFLSHSSKNNDSAVALRDWLAAQGWNDVFLDLDPNRGIAAGDRWERSLNQASLRCEAVLFLVSRAWLASDWCLKEFNLAHRLNKRLFGVLIEDIPIADLPPTLTGTWQVVPLGSGRDHVMLRALLPDTRDEVHVTFSKEGLTRLRIGLERAGLDARFFAWPPEADPKRTPYRGLLPLEAADAGIFFGREAPTIEALDRIRGIRDGAAPRLLVVLGASGAGKSSFLRAGLLPRLGRDDRNYLALPVMRPERAAINGENGLVRSLEGAFAAQGMVMSRAEIRKSVGGGVKTLRPLLQSLIERARTALVLDERNANPPMMVLAIDQGEELFLTEGASESAGLLNLLRELLADDEPALLVVITIRSDAYEQLQTAKALEGMTQHPLSLIPMPRGAYQAVIDGPAARQKETDRPIVIEPALTQALLSDIEEGSGRDALPLLAFTLERLYLEYGARGRLTLSDYNALGRIKGSIEAAIERAFAVADSDARIPRDREARLALLRHGLIPWLAGIDPDTGSPRRQKARVSEIPQEGRPLIDLLVEQRLLSTDVSEDTGETTIEPAHEALLRQWGSLQGWLQEDFSALANLETVKRAARDWATNAKGEDWLAHRAGRLEDAESLLQRHDLAVSLGVLDHAYLGACREREEEERREKNAALRRRLQLQRRFSIGTAIAAIVMAAVGALAFWQKTKADAATASARQNLAAADEATALAKANLEQAQANLTQAKVNLIRFLSRESKLSVKKGDSVTAIGLVLEGFDQKSNETDVYAKDLNAALYSALVEMRELSIFDEHRGAIVNAVFSPDGNRVLTASDDNTARIWDVATGRRIVLLQKHLRPLKQAAFSPDGRRVVTASVDSMAIVWDAETGNPIATLPSTSDAMIIVAFSPDGTRIATATNADSVQVWNTETGKQTAVLSGHYGGVNSVAFSPNGKLVVTASADKTARIFNALTGDRVAVLNGHYGEVSSAVFNPSGSRILTTSSDRTAIVWEAATGKQISVLLGHNGRINRGTFSQNGARIVTASEDNTARIWETSSGNQIAVLQGHDDNVNNAEFNGSGGRVVTASNDRTARIWDAATARQIAVLDGHVGAVNTAVFNPSGTKVITASNDKTARLWDASSEGSRIVLFNPLECVTGNDASLLAGGSMALSSDGIPTWDLTNSKTVASVQGADKQLSSASFKPDGKQVVTAGKDKITRIWDITTGADLRVLRGHDYRVKSASFSPDGSLVVTASLDGSSRVWSAITGGQIASLQGLKSGDRVNSAVFSPDGSSVMTASSDNTARIWDARNGKLLAVLRGSSDQTDADMNGAVFSPNGQQVVTGSSDGLISIWDLKTEHAIYVLRKPQSQFKSVAFSPDGRRVVAASSDATALVWDFATGKQLTLIGHDHDSVVNDAEFSPDGASLLTASSDQTVRIWNAATGNQIAVLRGHEDVVNSAAFSSDGKTIITASDDGTAKAWKIASNIDQLINLAKLSIPRCLSKEQRREYFLPEDIPDWCVGMNKWPSRNTRGQR